MNQFDIARQKNEKRLERLARSAANIANRVESAESVKSVKEPEKRETPKVVHQPGPMILKISGPCEMTLEVDYAGTLLSSQTNEQRLRELLKKCLLPIGKVR